MELIAVILLVLAVLFGEIALYRRHGLQGLSYKCYFSAAEIVEGEKLQFTEIVENDKVLPVPWLKAELTVPRWLDFPETHCVITDQERFVTGFFSVRSHAKVSRVWNVSCEKRGVYQVEHVVLVTSDLLGVVRLSLPASETGGTVTVLPRRFHEAGLLLPRIFRQQLESHLVRHSLLTDPCLSAGVREYVIGDPLNRMHWKASAHAGKLLMRQEERAAQQTVTVLLALETNAADSGRMTQDEVLLEHTIRVCAQCLWEFCQNGWMIRLCIGERNAEKQCYETGYGSGAGRYRKMLELLAALHLKQILPMSQLLRRACSVRKQELLLLITPYTDMQVAQWKEKNFGFVLVTGHAHDEANCADMVVPQRRYVETGGRQ